MEIARNEINGHVLRTAALSHFEVLETIYESDTNLPMHQHSLGYLSFVVTGGYLEVFQNQSEECSHGSVIFHPANEIHENIFLSKKTVCLNIHFSSGDSILDVDLRRRVHHRRGTAPFLFRKIYGELRNPDPFSFLIMDGLAMALLGELFRIEPRIRKVPIWVEEVEQFLQSSFHEKMNLISIADFVGIHPVHLSRSFHKYYGCTMGEYLRQVRVDFAATKLCTTSLNLSEIALESGFSDQSSFAKSFKRLTGYSPGQFRKRFRQR